MTVLQLDLFASDTETRRLVDGLTCIRDSVPNAMQMVIHLADWRPREDRSIGASGNWASGIRADGLRFEHEDDWWHGAHARGETYGWDRTPVHRLTWAELTEQIGDDPRRTQILAWSRSLTEPAWQDLVRPYELWSDPGHWNRDYITGDHERPGWDQRYAAWTTLQAILTSAITRLDPAGGVRP